MLLSPYARDDLARLDSHVMLNRTEDSKRTHLENVERLIRAAHSNTISVVQVRFRTMLLLGGIPIVKLGSAKARSELLLR